MTEHTEQTTAQPGPVPARIQLEDFIEAVTRGVTRALAAEDDASGYLATLGDQSRGSIINPTILIGIIAPPTTSYPGRTQSYGGQTTISQRG